MQSSLNAETIQYTMHLFLFLIHRFEFVPIHLSFTGHSTADLMFEAQQVLTKDQKFLVKNTLLQIDRVLSLSISLCSFSFFSLQCCFGVFCVSFIPILIFSAFLPFSIALFPFFLFVVFFSRSFFFSCRPKKISDLLMTKKVNHEDLKMLKRSSDQLQNLFTLVVVGEYNRSLISPSL